MDNNKIHDHLNDKSIRDFLGKQHQKTFRLALGGSIEWIEKEIAKLQDDLKHTKEHLAVIELLKMQGWEAFDVSSEIPYNPDEYFSFIGTKDEYNEFIELVHSQQRS